MQILILWIGNATCLAFAHTGAAARRAEGVYILGGSGQNELDLSSSGVRTGCYWNGYLTYLSYSEHVLAIRIGG